MTTLRRKSIAVSAATLMSVSGLTVGAATASAQTNGLENCATSQSVTKNLAGNYTVNKEVVGDGTVAPGGQVTFRTKVSGAGGLVASITDYHPAGFELVGARENVWWLVGGQKWADVTGNVTKDAAANSVKNSGSGWTTAGGATATLETTYKVPANAKPGTVLNTGAATSVTAVGSIDANPIDVCVTIREPNAVESVTGSLDGLGLGSVTSGSTAAGGVSSDPATFSSDIINGIDIGQLIGLS
ncbi:hypothetical protein DQ226_02540 [Dietzia maris]|uniref:Secreted protein n=1 Tax=Dietzia maris TaxID=37915 RepID=A0A365PD18_9ACTN|nr:hypothetical protein [Dietzia cinnamea]MCT1885730.1 hypothetical protein [Dietzia cinnamea]RBA39785.1 hypothetical protein DQ226_02540 [Dietzia maris]